MALFSTKDSRPTRYLARTTSSYLTVIVSLCLTLATFSVAANPEPVFQGVPPHAQILQSVIESAELSAQQDFEVSDHDLDDALKNMDYQTYRAIRFNADQSLWRNQKDFEVQFFHPGFLYQQPVTIYTVGSDNKPVRFAFNRNAFNYDTSAAPLAAVTKENNGYAGFRLHYPIKNTSYKDEFTVFLGASYFRLVGQSHVYGISARGLAIDTGMPEGEEFPHFTEFWLIEPKDGDPITVYARLESPSVSGAYKFVITPGSESAMQVESWLFARENVKKLGVAPFTSMFLYGENSGKRPDDYRPEVHDSDGMLLHTQSGEQIWRPLTNPSQLQITSMRDSAPKGFGLMQRDIAFDNYLDGEANYHIRPGLWVTPQSGFEAGRLELVEIPTNSETHDNIVAYWVPDAPFKAGEHRYFSYTLSTVTGLGEGTVDSKSEAHIARVVRTRQGAAVLPGEQDNAVATRRFIVDFAVPQGMTFDPAALEAKASVSQGTIRQVRVFPVDGGKALRATFLVTPQGNKATDMRISIHQNNQRVSEVWNYVYHAK
ncbi:glucan biosynthesis protein [Aestuariibacter sp. GS-14]|uniref:glucan biosynthesis protein n=1 Tax=Aestuariibacter sp. GS-14 TaxID=2590670 RepID=UPI002103D702|nr:glucan biosynthesis protein G [Aestuariibacter sp. GS-14]